MINRIINENLTRIEKDLLEIEGLECIDFIDIFPKSEEHKKQLDEEIIKISLLVRQQKEEMCMH